MKIGFSNDPFNERYGLILTLGFLSFVLAFFFVPVPYAFKWVTIVFFLLPGFLYCVYGRFQRLQKLERSPIFAPLCLFFLYGMTQSGYWAIQRHVPFRSITYTFLLLIFILATMALFASVRRRTLAHIKLALIGCATLAGGVVLMRYATGSGNVSGRLGGIGEYTNSNLAGFVFAQFGLVALQMTLTPETDDTSITVIWKRLLAGGALTICAAVIVLAQGKGVYLSFILSSLLLAGLLGYRKTAILTTLAFCTVCGLLYYLLQRPDAQLLLDHLPFGHALYARGDSYRIGVWETAIRLIPQHPWIGYGFETTYPYFLHPHNLVLSTLYYYGAIGLCLFLPCAVGTIWIRRGSQREMDNDEKAFYAAYCAFLIGGIADFGPILTRVSVYWVIFWLPFAIFHGLRLRGGLSQTS